MYPPKSPLPLMVAAAVALSGSVVASGTVHASPGSTMPSVCFEIGDDPCAPFPVVSGGIDVKNRTRRDRSKTVQVVIRDPDGTRIVKTRVTVDVPAKSTVTLDVGDFLDIDDPDTIGGAYRYVVRNVRPDGRLGRRNSKGTFFYSIAMVFPAELS